MKVTSIFSLLNVRGEGIFGGEAVVHGDSRAPNKAIWSGLHSMVRGNRRACLGSKMSSCCVGRLITP